MRLPIILACFSISVLMSCNTPKDIENYDKSIMPEGYDPNAKVPAAVSTSEVVDGQPNTSTINNGTANIAAPQMTNPQMANAPQNVQQTIQMATQNTAAPAGKGLNPAHGQPGHRCDIPEGSPLNSAPAAAINTPQNITTTQTVNTSKTVTAPGMNPPHGEAGHRCDISVGAPLDSKPAEVKAAPVTLPTQGLETPIKLMDTKKTDQ